MSINAMKKVFELSSLRGTERLIMVIVAWHIDDRRGYAWPSVETIADEAGLTRSGAIRAIARCVNSGELEIEHTKGGANNTNKYRISYAETVAPTPLLTVAPKLPPTVAAPHTNSSPQATPTVAAPHNNSSVGATQYKEINNNKQLIDSDGSHPTTAGFKPLDKALYFIRRGELPEKGSVLWKSIGKYGHQKLKMLADEQLHWEYKPFEEIYNEFKRI